jgi:phage terminase large subunit
MKNKISLAFNPHPGQQEIADANLSHRFVVCRAGRRFGKSALALNIILRSALHSPGRYWLVAPEYKQAKSIYWRDLVKEYIPDELLVKKNDNELILEIKTLVEGKTSIIEFKGSDNENSLRGAGLRGVVLDEFAFQKEYVWDKIISPMLVQTDGWALFITTPNGVANHFHDFWNEAVKLESQGDKDWRTFHFTSYDNPLIKKENLDKERERLTEEYFQQEYMADFARFTGLIFTEFDEKVHVQNFEVDESWSFYRSVDFGATDPNAVPFVGIDKDDVMYIYDELYVSDLETSELAELIKQKSAHRYFVASYGDSAGKQSMMDLASYGVFLIPVAKNSGEGARNWLIATIQQVQQRLKDRKIVIHPRCKATIKEFMSYSWRKDRMGEVVNLPEDKNNHMIDAIRYLVVSYKGNEDESFKSYLKQPVDSATGY